MSINNGTSEGLDRMPTLRRAGDTGTMPRAEADRASLDPRVLGQELRSALLAVQAGGADPARPSPAVGWQPILPLTYRWSEGPLMDGAARVTAMAGHDQVLGPVVAGVVVEMIRGDTAKAWFPVQGAAAPMAGMLAGAERLPQDEPMGVHADPVRGGGLAIEGERMAGRYEHHGVAHKEQDSHDK